jgi:hypothetical protein
MTKRGSFDDRVAKCVAQFREIEIRSSERGQRLEIDSRVPRAPKPSKDAPE